MADEITPPETYFNRRSIMKAGIIAAGAATTGWLYRKINGIDIVDINTPAIAGIKKSHYHVEGEETTPLSSVANYNNFYEFTTNKNAVAGASKDFKTAGWKIEVGGLCHKPKTFDMDDIRRLAPTEERVYRMRCVERWSMVVPWAGYSLSNLLAAVEPTADAKYVAFETLHDPVRMPGQNTNALEWPYVEGLRMDEAMHPLALLTTGLYGHDLPAQDGAPIRMILPWKYGFKGIKSIVKITLTATQPPTSWNKYASTEYGFFGNVNPMHAHPRWSQATEQRIGESGRRNTLPFNGYADQVASLYAGMNLDVNF